MAVKTSFSKSDFAKILSNYDLGEYLNSHSFAQGTVQTNLFIQTTKGDFAFRYYENRTRDSVLFETELLHYLKERDYPSPVPIHQKNGQVVGIYHSKPYVIFNFIEGEHVENPNISHKRELVSHIAKLHLITNKYNPTHLEARWNYSVTFCWNQAQIESKKLGTLNATQKLQWLRDELDKLTLPNSLPRGICHCDLHFTNVLFKQDKLVALLDFDDANYTFLLYDLVNLIDSWCWPRGGNLDLMKARGILQEYCQYRDLENDEKRHLYDLYKLQILIDSVWFFERGDVRDFNEKRKVDYLNNLGRESFNDMFFS